MYVKYWPLGSVFRLLGHDWALPTYCGGMELFRVLLATCRILLGPAVQVVQLGDIIDGCNAKMNLGCFFLNWGVLFACVPITIVRALLFGYLHKSP